MIFIEETLSYINIIVETLLQQKFKLGEIPSQSQITNQPNLLCERRPCQPFFEGSIADLKNYRTPKNFLLL